MLTTAQLREHLQPVLAAMGYEYVGNEFFTQGDHQGLRLYVDCEGGMSADDCAQASRQVLSILAVEDPRYGNYEVEVSSPGLDRLLFSETDFQRFQGERVWVRLHHSVQGRRKWEGLIQAVDQGRIVLMVDSEAVTFNFNDVDKARLVPNI